MIQSGREVSYEECRIACGTIYHLDGCIGKIDKLGQDLAILAGSIQLGGVP